MDIKTTLKNHQKFNNFPFHIERFCPTEPIPLHYHDCVELIFGTEGVMQNHVEDLSHQIGKSSLFVIGGRATHSMSEFRDFEGYRILFDMSLLEALSDEVKNTSGYISMFLLNDNGYINYEYKCRMSVKGKYYERISSLMEDLLYEYETEAFLNTDYMLSLFHSICILIIKSFHTNQNNTSKIFFDKAIAELIKHLNEKTTVDDIAKTFGMSGRYFRKIFTRWYGISPSQFVIDTRLHRAKLLLSCSDKTITEIAFSCGFYDSSHMLRAFKQYEGMTPKEYRKKSRM